MSLKLWCAERGFYARSGRLLRKEDSAESAKVELEPKLEGRQMLMILAPR